MPGPGDLPPVIDPRWRFQPRGTRGFTVYRPEHWSLADTDLYYGDILGGGAAHVFGYEVDGLDYTMRDVLPYPTFSDGAPASTEIIAMGLAVNTEVMRGRRHEVSYYGEQSPGHGEVALRQRRTGQRGEGVAWQRHDGGV